ncbi:FAD-dependent monooxygenase [Streptomyces sp. NBC_01142]|uniref:FAD-dependent monooxygenase n=1 Tax=Streptomyces sp. NBC_01142 TaxID=2975865 RepID=UPI002252F94C|nr:FAD-dependent monooxygenase [Streptomyces sp. NBC_01142]MCX4820271.1 FAD-dependent monooxygenase [Streptomyces sp. NBC_01142]
MRKLRVAVVGGSIAGCAAALAVHRAGVDEITVYERSAGDLADRGVGLAVHNARYAELEAAGYLDAAMPWVQLTQRRWYVRDGDSGNPLGRHIGTLPFPFRTYNWGPLWRELRARVPGSVRFRTGTTVDSVEASATAAEVRTPGLTQSFDLVIGADGYRSVVRAAACPDVRPEYAGYLAWRGAFPVSRLADPSLWNTTDCIYVVFSGGHMIVYRIPDGAGGHRVNWILYATPPPGLDAHLTTPTSLPPGTLTEALHHRLAHIAETRLPPYWGALIRQTAPAEVFSQPMYDFTAPRVPTDRFLLLGDAAAVARPHTGAGAVKALQDATTLESAFTTTADWRAALRTYDEARATSGRTMVNLGRSLGHALVQGTPDWRTLDQAGLEEWWGRADGAGVFGGRELKR